MIITKIRLQEEHPMTGVSDTWPLPICDLNLDSTAGENGYIIKDSQGLGPPNLISVVEGFDSFGTPVKGSVPEKRDIVLRIGFMPGLGQSYSTLREDLYRYIDREVLVMLMNDSMVIAQASGYIRQFETAHFSNQPEIQITIECAIGEFSSPNSVDIPFTDLDTLNPVINYEEGTAPTGLDLQFTVSASADGFSIINHSYGPGIIYNIFEVTYPLIVDDLVTISTHSKNKHIILLRDSLFYDLAGYISPGAVWPKLYSGVNAFEWTFASSWMDWVGASYIPKYWGV